VQKGISNVPVALIRQLPAAVTASDGLGVPTLIAVEGGSGRMLKQSLVRGPSAGGRVNANRTCRSENSLRAHFFIGVVIRKS
jgi:hypothetical protein